VLHRSWSSPPQKEVKIKGKTEENKETAKKPEVPADPLRALVSIIKGGKLDESRGLYMVSVLF
jgi:hypothetical protein